MRPTILLIHSISDGVLRSSSGRGKPPGAMVEGLGHAVGVSAPAPCVEYSGCPWHPATAPTHAACHGCQEAFNPRMIEQSLGTTCQQLPLCFLFTQSPHFVISPNSPVCGFWEQLLTPPPPWSLQVCAFYGSGADCTMQGTGAGWRTQTSGCPDLISYGTPSSNSLLPTQESVFAE